MFDELAILNGSRLMLVAGISYTLWSLHGIFWRGWSVGTLFFWMWWELLLSGLSMILLVHRWHRLNGMVPGHGDGAGGTAVSVLIGLGLGTMFTLQTLGAEHITAVEGTLQPFLEARQPMMAFIAFGMLLVHLLIAHGRRFTLSPKAQLVAPLYNRLVPMLGIYAVVICDHHWRGLHEIDDSRYHQLLMGGTLLGLKLFLEGRTLLRQTRNDRS
ncbi:MAG: hypothetical protein IAE77_25465 [Prosthecobacter sp.]|uniref:hypothetical protein n=1 Tax=Prosthecobacter sp. TaxID=1965333 RepID=UPI0019DC6D29|nr:hypothetical protein [Prosthecobacter sp.]MBE2286831.1 hypothetical protein [Prosthecobacter sp.]